MLFGQKGPSLGGVSFFLNFSHHGWIKLLCKCYLMRLEKLCKFFVGYRLNYGAPLVYTDGEISAIMNHDPLSSSDQSGQQTLTQSQFNQEWNRLKSEIDKASAETQLLEEKLRETQLQRDTLLKGTVLKIFSVHRKLP